MNDPVAFWIEKGGAIGVITLLIWFYRRDWSTLTQYWQQQNTLLMEIVQTNTRELGKMEESVRMMHAENTAGIEAIRTRIHEVHQTLAIVTATRRKEPERS